jgi:hypothetical protein
MSAAPPANLADLKATCGSRPPALVELLDAYGEAREEAGRAGETPGGGADYALYTGYATELREEILRRNAEVVDEARALARVITERFG